MIQFRWIIWEPEEGGPPFGAISIGGDQPIFQVLQYRERENILEMGLHQAIWSEWKDT